jgi:hypothetical protein
VQPQGKDANVGANVKNNITGGKGDAVFQVSGNFFLEPGGFFFTDTINGYSIKKDRFFAFFSHGKGTGICRFTGSKGKWVNKLLNLQFNKQSYESKIAIILSYATFYDELIKYVD